MGNSMPLRRRVAASANSTHRCGQVANIDIGKQEAYCLDRLRRLSPAVELRGHQDADTQARNP
jgi:hypothetical protein